MGGRNYNHRLALAAGEAVAHEAGRVRLAEALARLACGRGEHRTETDPVTGDEVCRWCTEVIE